MILTVNFFPELRFKEDYIPPFSQSAGIVNTLLWSRYADRYEKGDFLYLHHPITGDVWRINTKTTLTHAWDDGEWISTDIGNEFGRNVLHFCNGGWIYWPASLIARSQLEWAVKSDANEEWGKSFACADSVSYEESEVVR